ncbi:CxxH/CxxC protein (TIGR04129 family) [Sedimentibacter acidaminivorans]|jgi:CxxH/CxxC protein (TIGR04129 family)|uniref:CxxH/CxxC protein (TIGR04129 family) n=1 Tax=Sedimentibacter acidaminivorans TaxID=913099 RepID=A0ABS4GGM3_9FIRM|nr:CxxH/CxxC protein [Sedimentibacter acidaminivorans]MBP1926799.1 CxxH/CxxC protein (TIGR04129 family) [Sedimentibacter acidaminivorans]
MVENKNLYACKDHIEVALDDYINFEENAPYMVEVSDEEQVVCSYCEQKAKYKLLS